MGLRVEGGWIEQLEARSRLDANFAHLADLGMGFEPLRRPGKQGHPDVEFAATAHAYVEKCVKGQVKARVVAENLGISRTVFANRIMEARRRGLLSESGGPGVAAGALTEKAIRLLALSADEEMDHAAH